MAGVVLPLLRGSRHEIGRAKTAPGSLGVFPFIPCGGGPKNRRGELRVIWFLSGGATLLDRIGRACLACRGRRSYDLLVSRPRVPSLNHLYAREGPPR